MFWRSFWALNRFIDNLQGNGWKVAKCLLKRAYFVGFSRLIVSYNGSTFTFWQLDCFARKPKVVLLTRCAYFLTPKLPEVGYVYNLETISTYYIIPIYKNYALIKHFIGTDLYIKTF